MIVKDYIELHPIRNIIVDVVLMEYERKPAAALILSLLAGIFILIGGLVGVWMMSFFALGFMDSMMQGMWGGMMTPGRLGLMELVTILTSLNIVFGALVVLGAIMLYMKPAQHTAWGTVVLVFSVLSIVGGMGGFGVGMILGIIGGILALTQTYKPQAQT